MFFIEYTNIYSINIFSHTNIVLICHNSKVDVVTLALTNQDKSA